MAFEDIAGNSRIKTILRLALRRGRVPSSLLLSGPAGVGKRETAMELAKALNCGRLQDDACGECESCRAIDGGNHPDILDVKIFPRTARGRSFGQEEDRGGDDGDDGDDMESGPDPARKKGITIHQIRRAVSIAFLKPMTARRRVFLIDDAVEMTTDAANAFLKGLEEPPPQTHFILVTTNPDLLLPTIRSRCQTLAFGPIAPEDIVGALRARGVEDSRARLLALVVRGDLEKALTLDWDEVRVRREEAWALLRSILLEDGGPAFLRRFGQGRKSVVREDLLETLELFSGFGRDLLLIAETGGAGRWLNPDLEDALREASPAVDAGRALSLITSAEAALTSLDRNVHAGLLAGAFYARLTG